jgi:hypothetical protein
VIKGIGSILFLKKKNGLKPLKMPFNGIQETITDKIFGKQRATAIHTP